MSSALRYLLKILLSKLSKAGLFAYGKLTVVVILGSCLAFLLLLAEEKVSQALLIKFLNDTIQVFDP